MSSSLGYLDYTWADDTFSGGGFGVVQTSLGWDARSERVSGFENWLSSAGISSLTLGGSAAMVAFYPRRGGRNFLVCKRQLAQDSAGRRGRYIVRVFADPARELTLPQAMDLAVGTLPSLEWDTGNLPRRDGPPPSLVTVERAPADPRALAAIIWALETGAAIRLSGPNPCGIVAAATELLPHAITDRISVASHHISGPPPTITLAESDLLKLESLEAQPLPLGLADEAFARDYLNFAVELGAPEADDILAWRRWVEGQRRRRAASASLTILDIGLELADDRLPDARRAELTRLLCSREFAGELSPSERSQVRAAMGHDAAMGVTSALLGSPLDVLLIPDAVDALGTWGATDGEIHDLMMERWNTLAFDPPHARDAERDTLMAWLPAFVEEFPERLGDIAVIEWVEPKLSRGWDELARKVTREFWCEAQTPDSRLAGAARRILVDHPERVRDELGPIKPGGALQRRVEAALRCLPEGEMWEAFLALAVTPASVPVSESPREGDRKRWSRRLGLS